ncbi:MAG: hypothetical protein DWH78_04075 [Planctomycetota bacterium]|jgi:hypothetical protein|nr:MAG: hypothetical protein DWH78_04075 [Planctomycetota bacterium]
MNTLLTAPPTHESVGVPLEIHPTPTVISIEEKLGPGKFPGVWKPVRSFLWFLHVSFGTACLVLILAILAAIPGLNILTLGYLIDPQKRVAQTGQLRNGFPLMVLAPRLGVIVFFCILFLIPVRLQATRISDAAVILGEAHARVGQMALNLRILQTVIATHLILAIARGGTPGCFLRPIKNVSWFLRKVLTSAGRAEMSTGLDQVLDVVKPWQHFWAGFKAFTGAVLWLLIPAGLLVAYSAPGRTAPLYGVASFLGVILMIPVTAWLPLLQVHQAVTGRFRAIFEVRAARRIIRNAPVAWMLTTILMYAMTFPLYLAKIRLLPADAMLVLTPFFIILTYPARILVARAYHRGMTKEQPAWRTVHWGIRLAMLPLLLAHAVFLFFTPAISELGKNAPLENQAFLGPVPYAQWQRR